MTQRIPCIMLKHVAESTTTMETYLLVFLSRDFLQEIWNALPWGDVETQSSEEIHDLLPWSMIEDVPCKITGPF